MSSDTVTLKLTESESKVLSHIKLTPFFAGFGGDRIPEDPDIIRSLLYFTRTAVQRIPGEMNKIVDIARKYVPKQPWEKGADEKPQEIKAVKEFELPLEEFDDQNIKSLEGTLKSNGIEAWEDKNVLVRICFELMFRGEEFDGTIKKKFLDSIFLSVLYRLNPVTILKILNESTPKKEDFNEDELEILEKMRSEREEFEKYRMAVYSLPSGPTEANVLMQRYGAGQQRESRPKTGSRSSITITENDFTLDFHVSRMRQYRSFAGNFDFDSVLLGYAFHILSWTDETTNMPYLTRRMYSLTYPPPPPRVSAEIRRVRAGYQYQPTVESFLDYRESYSYSAWALDSMLTDFLLACKNFM